MDIEQLKLVLDTLKSVGHEAGSLAVLWLWLKFGAIAFSHIFWGVVVFSAAWTIVRLVRSQSDQENYEHFLREMRDTLGTGTGGCMTSVEYQRTTTLLRQMALDHRAQKRN